MNKKLWLGFAAVFVVLAVCDTIINTLLLSSAFAATASLWRSTADMKVWVFYVIYLFVAFFFTLIFSKGYEGKGVMEGVRYGIYIGMMMAISTAFGTYGAMPIPCSMAVQWFIYGLIEYILCGIAVALVYGKLTTAAPVKPA